MGVWVLRRILTNGRALAWRRGIQSFKYSGRTKASGSSRTKSTEILELALWTILPGRILPKSGSEEPEEPRSEGAVAGKGRLTRPLLGPDAGSSVRTPIFLSPGHSAREWLALGQNYDLVKREGAGKPVYRRPGDTRWRPASLWLPAPSGQSQTGRPRGAGLVGRSRRGGARAHEPITADVFT